MVGTRTSTGCDNCLKRKKKCGGQLPSCVECVRAGWTCPGYRTRWKFVDETGPLAAHYAKRCYIYEYVDLDQTGSVSTGVEDTFNRGILSRKRQKLNPESRSYWRVNQIISSIPRNLDLHPKSSAFVFCLGYSADEALVPLRSFGSYFDFIPARLGLNTALDDAASCLFSIYCGALSTPRATSGAIFKQYSKALNSLRIHISDSSLQMQPETLCATILLQLCELVVNHVDNGEWSDLARGTAVLIRSRGTDRYESDFECAMFEAQLPFILGQSMRFNEPCFVADQAWQYLLAGSVRHHHKTQVPSLSLRTQLCSSLAYLPALMIDLRAFRLNYNAALYEHLDWSSQILELIRRTSALRDAVEEWLTVRGETVLLFEEPHLMDLTSIEPLDIPFQEQTSYQDLLSGVLDCVSHKALLTIENILDELYQLKPESPEDDPSGIAHQIKAINTFFHEQNMEWRRRRVRKSFHFVQKENAIAAKPLEIGMRLFGLSIAD